MLPPFGIGLLASSLDIVHLESLLIGRVTRSDLKPIVTLAAADHVGSGRAQVPAALLVDALAHVAPMVDTLLAPEAFHRPVCKTRQPCPGLFHPGVAVNRACFLCATFRRINRFGT